MSNFLSYITLRTVINNFVVAVIAYVLGYYFTSLFHAGSAEIGGLWSVISGVFVVEDRKLDTVGSARSRIVGTFIGVAISGVYLYLFPFNVFGFAACIALGVTVCKLFGVIKYLKLVGITISVVMIVSIVDKEIAPFMNAALRFVESIIGTVVALIVVHLSDLVYSDKE